MDGFNVHILIMHMDEKVSNIKSIMTNYVTMVTWQYTINYADNGNYKNTCTL